MDEKRTGTHTPGRPCQGAGQRGAGLGTEERQRGAGTLSPQLPAVPATLPTASGPEQPQLLGAQ